MERDQDQKEKKTITLSEALAKLPPDSEWFKLTNEERAEFERGRFFSKLSQKIGFRLGGSFYPPKARL